VPSSSLTLSLAFTSYHVLSPPPFFLLSSSFPPPFLLLSSSFSFPFPPAPTCSHLLPPAPTCSYLLPPAPSHLLQSAPTCSHLFLQLPTRATNFPHFLPERSLPSCPITFPTRSDQSQPDQPQTWMRAPIRSFAAGEITGPTSVLGSCPAPTTRSRAFATISGSQARVSPTSTCKGKQRKGTESNGSGSRSPAVGECSWAFCLSMIRSLCEYGWPHSCCMGQHPERRWALSMCLFVLTLVSG
jgi:hypothetical protein